MAFVIFRNHDLAGFVGKIRKLAHGVHRKAPPSVPNSRNRPSESSSTLFQPKGCFVRVPRAVSMSKYWRMLATNRVLLSLNSAYKPDLPGPRGLPAQGPEHSVSARPCFQKTGIVLLRTSSLVNSFPSSHCNLASVKSTARLANKGPNGPLLQRERLYRRTPWRPAVNNRVIDLAESRLRPKIRSPLASVNPNKYIQHNLQGGTRSGRSRAHQEYAARTRPSHTIRVFEDGDYVCAHTCSTTSSAPRIGFDIFRFEDSLIVEHWG